MPGNFGSGAQGGDGTGGGGASSSSSGGNGGGGRGAGDSAHGYGNGASEQGGGNQGQSGQAQSGQGQSLADALGVGQQTQGDGSATPNAHDTAQTMSSMFNMSDKALSRGLSELGYSYADRAGVLGIGDAAVTGPWSEALSNIGETALSITNPVVGLALQLSDLGQRAYSRGVDSIKGSVPSLVGMGVNAFAGPLVGAAANVGTSLAMGDESGAARTGGGVLGSIVGGYLGGNPVSSKVGSLVGSKVGGLLANSVANAAPSSGAEGGNHSISGQGGRSDFAEGSLSKALLEGAGNTGNTGNTGRTGLNNAIAPKQIVSPIQTAMANYSQFS
jgi:hypothetical protein